MDRVIANVATVVDKGEYLRWSEAIPFYSQNVIRRRIILTLIKNIRHEPSVDKSDFQLLEN